MKFAVVTPADQTIAYVTADGGMTTKHHEAHLWDTREEAAAVAVNEGEEVEEVDDEAAFRAQPDTW